MRIGLLNNLRAGRSDAQVTRLLGYLRHHPDVVHVETDQAHAVPEALGDLARQDVELLVVNGGDGTLEYVLSQILAHQAFEDRLPLIAPLRGGRTNMTALDLGVQRDPLKALASLIEAARGNQLQAHIVDRPVLHVEHGPSTARESVYGMFFGLGMIHRAIELVHRMMPKGHQGVFGATVVTGALVGRSAFGDSQGVLTPDKVQILLDGQAAEHGEFSCVISSTLHRLFARMRPFWGEGPGRLRFTGVAAGSTHKVRAFSGILRGAPNPELATPENGYTSHNVDRAELRFDCGFTIDGELFPPSPGQVVTLSTDSSIRFVRA